MITQEKKGRGGGRIISNVRAKCKHAKKYPTLELNNP
jgi:hypothetical protein